MDTTIDFYVKVAHDYPILSKEEERALIAKWRYVNEDRLRELLILHNIRGAVNFGTYYYANLVSKADGVQLAIIGMIKAAEAFDLDAGIKFLTFAFSYMRTSINRVALKTSNLISYVAASMDAPIEKHTSKSDGQSDATMGDFLMSRMHEAYKGVSPTNIDQITNIFQSDEGVLIRNVVQGLYIKQRDKDIFCEYYNLKDCGFIDDENVTRASLGKKYEMCRERVRQIIEDVLVKVRESLSKKFEFEEAIRIRKEMGETYAKRGKREIKGGRINYVKISGIYKRISDEQMESMRERAPKRRANLTVHYYGGGHGCFYSDEYQAVVKGMRKVAVTQSAEVGPKGLHPALARRLQQVVENVDSQVGLDDKKLASPDSSATHIEDITDINEVEIAMLETKKEAAEWQEQERQSYCVGALEDDGDQDYELEAS